MLAAGLNVICAFALCSGVLRCRPHLDTLHPELDVPFSFIVLNGHSDLLPWGGAEHLHQRANKYSSCIQQHAGIAAVAFSNMQALQQLHSTTCRHCSSCIQQHAGIAAVAFSNMQALQQLHSATCRHCNSCIQQHAGIAAVASNNMRRKCTTRGEPALCRNKHAGLVETRW
jgi:hypothetical protein